MSDPLAIDPENLPEGEAKAVAVQAMFDRVAPRYDVLNRVLTFGLDELWRRSTVRRLGLPARSRVVDLACGTGDFCRALRRRGHEPIGLDFSHGMLGAARTDAPLVQGDALRLPLPDASVDGVTCGFALRNFVDIEAFFAEIGRVVRPGGRIGILEVAEPPNPVLRAGHALYFGRVVPFVGGLFSDRVAYAYLPKSVAYLPPTEELVAIVEDAGFADVDHRFLTAGIAQGIYARRRG